MIKINVEILDVNDHSPSFGDDWSTLGLTLNISEAVLPGSAFSLPVAVDEDSGTFGVEGYRLMTADQLAVSTVTVLPFDVVYEPR